MLPRSKYLNITEISKYKTNIKCKFYATFKIAGAMFCNLSTTARITSQRNVGRGKCVACDCSYSCGETHDDNDNDNKTDKKKKRKKEIVANCATATPMQTFLDTSLNSFACDAMREHGKSQGARGKRQETVPRWTDTRSLECQNVPARH